MKKLACIMIALLLTLVNAEVDIGCDATKFDLSRFKDKDCKKPSWNDNKWLYINTHMINPDKGNNTKDCAEGVIAYCIMKADGKTFDRMKVDYYLDNKCKLFDNTTDPIELPPGKCVPHPWNKGSFTKLVIKEEQFLSNGAIGGIAIGAIFFAFVLFFIYYYKKNQMSKMSDSEDEESDEENEEEEDESSSNKKASSKPSKQKKSAVLEKTDAKIDKSSDDQDNNQMERGKIYKVDAPSEEKIIVDEESLEKPVKD